MLADDIREKRNKFQEQRIEASYKEFEEIVLNNYSDLSWKICVDDFPNELANMIINEGFDVKIFPKTDLLRCQLLITLKECEA